jgi:hypothetical protein
VDDHPRHVYSQDGTTNGKTAPDVAKKALAAAGDDFESIYAQVTDDTVTYKHMDCCRTDGCPDGTCDEVTKGAEDKKGNALVKHLTSLTPKED